VGVLRRREAAAGKLRKETVMPKVNVADELRNAPVEPLLPIEKKLIGWSLGLGIGLLIVLGIVNHLFPV
jgi:hypothetical protein